MYSVVIGVYGIVRQLFQHYINPIRSIWAKVYMNDEYLGVTPFTYSDTKIVGSVTSLRIEKEGYEPLYTYISRNEEVDVGAIVAGIFVWVPFLWTMKYKPIHNYELRPVKP